MQLLILVPLALMILSDYRSRTVVLWQLLLFGAIVLITSLMEKGLHATSMDIATNIFLSMLIGSCVYIYFLLKYRSGQSIMGKGDILFILFLTPLFTPRLFLVFMLVSFAATLSMWGIHTLVRKRNTNIPLISGVGVCLCVLLIYQQLR
ncbi:hypothetical protein [Proteiniphilum propionicum]|jgi:Flp pilus assembly protein protease CpaA|uniref:hypothetical protein n=1 Tax=Proteiniphilum propionicum TaxID=2829812 RepID=UPI001EEC1ADC|nr:hypothetical protein [Proteiniphilum propionicum]ULB34286.1 hypothetical protein KDN43_15195 [Proteiniphilum propionicum]